MALPPHAPPGDVDLGGKTGKLYYYDHCDGPFCSRMTSYVIDHRGKQLGLEFRSEGELGEVNQMIAGSFRLTR